MAGYLTLLTPSTALNAIKTKPVFEEVSPDIIVLSTTTTTTTTTTTKQTSKSVPSNPLLATMAEPTTTIPKGSWVLVTGANGFVASHVVREFLQRGYKVRGTVRDLEKSSWLIQDVFKSYADNGDFELVFVPDLAARDAFDDAVKGISAIVHVASITTFSPDPNEVVTQTVAGATSILHAALREPLVKAFVYTGSITAATMCVPGNSTHVERDTWNEEALKLAWAPPPYEPSRGMFVYNASKTEAEVAVWKFVAEKKTALQSQQHRSCNDSRRTLK
jgi:hypothetical protein